MKRFTITMLAGLGLLAASCEKDNYSPPSSQLTGRVTFQNEVIGVRGQGGVQLELWQRGEALRNKIQVFVAQDGSYSATLFDGNYKLTRLRDNGPWQNNTDSIDVVVRGNTVIDVPVQPYFVIRNTTITKAGNVVTASALISQATAGRTIESATLFLNSTQFVDTNNSLIGQVRKASADLGNLTQPQLFSFTVPAATRGVVYARIGVKTQGVNELIYSPVQRLSL